MSDQVDIKFFPAQQEKNGYLGGGYITSGILKTRFSVFKSSKAASGFYVSLPSMKKPDGSWDNQIEFKNKDASDSVTNHIAPQVASLLGGGVQVNASVAPTQVEIQNNAARVGTPF
jgi:hypothetical protein